MINWIKYSGASMAITINPLHWQMRPQLARCREEWDGPRCLTLQARWLMITVRIWCDDGSW